MKKLLFLLLMLTTTVCFTSCLHVPDSTTWEIEDGVLTIYADGYLGEFCMGLDVNEKYFEASGTKKAPWIGESFHTVVLKSGINTINSHAFGGCKDLEKVIIEGESVRIEHCAFYDCTNLKEIENIDRATHIETHAFYGCDSLSSVKLGEQLVSLDSDAFIGCTGLKEIYLPATYDSDTHVKQSFVGLFDGCTSLESINVEEGNPVFASHEGVLYTADMRTLLVYPAGKKDETYVVPSEVSEFQMYSFKDNNYIKCLDFEGKILPNIDSLAFQGSASLETVILSKDVTYFNPKAFGENITEIRK